MKVDKEKQPFKGETMKKVLLILLAIILIFSLTAFMVVKVFFDAGELTGNYEYITDGFTYSLTVDKRGNFSISDVGTGYSVMKGRMFQTGETEYVLFCLFDEDYDGDRILGMKEKVNRINIRLDNVTSEMTGEVKDVLVMSNGNGSAGFVKY